MKKITSLFASLLAVVAMNAAVVTFEPSDFSGGTSGTGSSMTQTKGGVTITTDLGYAHAQNFRVYNGGKLTISASEAITSIAFEFPYSDKTGGLNTSYSPNATSWSQTMQGQARFSKITVATGGDAIDTGGDGGDDTPAVSTDAITVSKALEVIAALKDSAKTDADYVVEGIVVSIEENAVSEHGNETFYIADSEDGDQLYIYRGNTKVEIAVGAKVQVTGKLWKFIKDGQVAPQISKGTVVIVTQGDGSTDGEGDGDGDEDGAPTYDGEPTTATTINATFEKAGWADATEYYEIESGSVIEMYLTNETQELGLVFLVNTIDETFGAPEGTYRITDSYAIGTAMASPGGDDYYDYGCYLANYEYYEADDQDPAGYYWDHAYYLVSGMVTIASDAAGVKLTVNAKSYNGSTITVNYTGAIEEYTEDTAVENVTVEPLNLNAPMYNVLGIQVGKDYKGVVIQNGQKYLLR